MINIAVLITCHNRIELTLRCLNSLDFKNKSYKLEVYLLDDGSTDDTALRVKKFFPNTRIYNGDGSFFWAGGMRFLFKQALEKDHDYYLWLNDDCELVSDAIARMLKEDMECKRIIVGSCLDKQTHELTYGGKVRCGIFGFQTKFKRFHEEISQKIFTFNGNIVLISKNAADRVGGISQKYSHSCADIDYGVRATKKGVEILLAPGFHGYCSSNTQLLDRNKPFIARFNDLINPTKRPIKEYIILFRRMSPFFFWLALIKLIWIVMLRR